MKIRLTLSFFSLLLALFLLPGNKNGRASQAGKGNTGAPGDESVNGSPYTCMNCHDDGAFNPFVTVSVRDSADNIVTQYRPGQLYTARVSIAANGAAGYGFQMIALKDNGNTDLDGFSDVNPNNYKLATISNGRTYAEHPTVSTSNNFSVRWTAPPAGTGNVTFYAAGNAVNNNNNSDGDGAAITSLQLSEEIVLATGDALEAGMNMQIFPNPVEETAKMDVMVAKGGTVPVTAYDLAGNVVWFSQIALQAGNNVFDLPTPTWSAGTYILTVGSRQNGKTVKILKL